MKIHLITCCYNEERLLPYFLKHYGQFCDLITFYDDNSTDKSLDIIRSFPNTEIIPQNTGLTDNFDDNNVLNIKNEKYKIDRNYDWVIIVDIDEFLYNSDLRGILERYKKEGITIPYTTGFDMYAKKFPTEDKQIYEIVQQGRLASNHSKKVIFSPRDVDINYTMGCHTCNPSGNIVYSLDNELKILHYVYLSHEYMIKKRKNIFDRLCENNKLMGFGTHNGTRDYAGMSEEEYDLLAKNMTNVL